MYCVVRRMEFVICVVGKNVIGSVYCVCRMFSVCVIIGKNVSVNHQSVFKFWSVYNAGW